MNKFSITCLALLTFGFYSCGRSTSDQVPQGSWSVKNISYAPSTESQDERDIAQIAALSLVGEDMKPRTIDINSDQLVLWTNSGDSAVLDYKQIAVNGHQYTLQTEKGQCTITIQDGDKATLQVAEATYTLARQAI